MFIRYVCNNCGQKCKSAQEYAGLNVNCSRCALPLEIPISSHTVEIHEPSPELLLAAASHAEPHREKIEQEAVQNLIPEKLPEPVVESNKLPVQQPVNKSSEPSTDSNKALCLHARTECIHGFIFQIANKKGLLLHWLKQMTISHLKQKGGGVKIKEKWYRPTPGLVSFSLAVICITIILTGAFRKSSVTTSSGRKAAYNTVKTATQVIQNGSVESRFSASAVSIEVGGRGIIIPAPQGQIYIGTTHETDYDKSPGTRMRNIYASKDTITRQVVKGRDAYSNGVRDIYTMLAIFAPPEEAQKTKDRNYIPRLGATVQVSSTLPENPTLKDYQEYRQGIIYFLSNMGQELGDYHKFVCKFLGGPVYFSWLSAGICNSPPVLTSGRYVQDFWYQVVTTAIIYVKGRILYLRLYDTFPEYRERAINPDDYRDSVVKWLSASYAANGEQVD